MFRSYLGGSTGNQRSQTRSTVDEYESQSNELRENIAGLKDTVDAGQLTRMGHGEIINLGGPNEGISIYDHILLIP